MKCLIIGGNRFVGQRLSLLLNARPGIDLHILNRTGQAPHCKNAVVYKSDRLLLSTAHLDADWDVVFDFAAFTAADAQSSTDFFKKVGLYVAVSTVSIYDYGNNLKEEAFTASTFDLSQPADPENVYKDGKRRMEATFAKAAKFPTLAVRLPFILGPDDYTGRLDFHIDRARQGLPIYAPKPDVKISMIHAGDAADFLNWVADRNLTGAINVGSPMPITIKQLLAQIQLVLDKPPVWANTENEDNHSPYGYADDMVLNVERMLKAGFKTRPILEWLPELIAPMPEARKGFVH